MIKEKSIKQQIKSTAGNTFIAHAGFILCTSAVLVLVINYYFGNSFTLVYPQGFIAILYFFVCVYTGRWICRTWFLRNKFILFSLFCVLGFFILLRGGRLIVNNLLRWNQKNVDEFYFAITPLFILGMLIGIFAPMIKAMLQKQVLEARKTAEQKQGELSLLRSQLSPHFLFNTLNNLYGISLEQHEKIPLLLLKLSELLRYAVYEASQPFIPLTEEVQYINNYIAFEKIRIGDRLNLKTCISEIQGREIKIAPMLLIVFIENAFKHSKNSFDQIVFIDVSLKIEDDTIVFTISNSCSRLREDRAIRENSGLGLENVRRRLELIYADEYALCEEGSVNFYSVKLKLKAR